MSNLCFQQQDQEMTVHDKTLGDTSRLRASCESCRRRKVRCSGPSGLSGTGQCGDCLKFNRRCDFRERIVAGKRKRVDVRVKELEAKIDELAAHLQISGHGSGSTSGTQSAGFDALNEQPDRPEYFVNPYNSKSRTLYKAPTDNNSPFFTQTDTETTSSVYKTPTKAPIISDPVTRSQKKPHKKSRTGCLVCKKRKLKCDETKPECKRCMNHGDVCVYSQSPTKAAAEMSPAQSLKSSSDELSLTTHHQVNPLLPTHFVPVSVDERYLHQVFNHFESSAITTFGAPHMQDAMRKNCLSLASGAPFLFHAICAFTALHIHKLRDTTDERLELFSSYHLKEGLKLYSNELYKPLGVETMDAVFGTCMLLALISYTSTDFNDIQPSMSFINSQSPDALTWLSSQVGFMALKRTPSMRSHLSDSIWRALFSESDAQGIFLHSPTGTDGIPNLWQFLCNIDETSNHDNNPYYTATRLCLIIQDLDATNRDNFSSFISFPGRMRPEFIELVKNKDPVALLILSYWLAKMCEMNQWWCARRVKSECWAICQYLDTTLSMDELAIRALLAKSMRACGYSRGQPWSE